MGSNPWDVERRVPGRSSNKPPTFVGASHAGFKSSREECDCGNGQDEGQGYPRGFPLKPRMVATRQTRQTGWECIYISTSPFTGVSLIIGNQLRTRIIELTRIQRPLTRILSFTDWFFLCRYRRVKQKLRQTFGWSWLELPPNWKIRSRPSVKLWMFYKLPCSQRWWKFECNLLIGCCEVVFPSPML